MGILFSLVTTAVAQLASPPPSTPKRPVVDTYFNTQVTDNYRWLEDGTSPEVKQWVAAQNAASTALLDKLPQRDSILAYLKKEEKNAHTGYYNLWPSGDRAFALRYDPNQSEDKFVTFDSLTDKASERLILDFAHFEAGKNFWVEWYRVSPNGKLAGFALSTGGSEDASLYVIDTTTGKQVYETVPNVNFATAAGGMLWKPDSSGFYFTHYPRGSERTAADMHFYQQVYFHKLGTPVTEDTYVLGKEFPRIAETHLIESPDRSHMLVTVGNGDGGECETFVRNPGVSGQADSFAQLTHFSDKIVEAEFGVDNSLWLISHKASPNGEVLHLPAGDLNLAHAAVVVPASQAAIEGAFGNPNRLFIGTSKLYVTVIDGGPEVVRTYTLAGKRLADVPTPKVASISALGRTGNDSFIYTATTYNMPYQLYSYSGSGEAQALPFGLETDVHLDDIEVRRVFATSKDGTKVPMTILMRKGTRLDGTNPTLITGYGGYGVSETPHFMGYMRSWFDHGGIYVVTNIRGGGEYGDAWHLAGNLLDKQNVFDDFAACAQYLINEKYTSPEHLAAQGASNGGLLMGAMITQHPELFRVVLSAVGFYDMLRFELDSNGSFNTTEFGSVKVPSQFQALYAYSPYHHVVNGTKYPAIFFTTGDNDHRVDPMNSRKMTAELQAATSSGRPILLLTDPNAGHMGDADIDAAIKQEADNEAFLFAELGMAW